MESLVRITIVMFFFSIYLLAQVPGNTTLTTGSTSILKETTGQTTTHSYGVYGIGMETVGNTSKVYRTYFDFSLEAIPTNATIQSVTVYISNGKNGYTQKITQIASLNQFDLSSCWTAIGNANSLHTGVAYNASSFTSAAIKTAIQGSLSGRKIIIGVLSESESTNGSNTSVSLSLYVTYTRPLATINYSVRNDMDGFVGGNIGVGINAPATSQGSPYSSTATEGNTINVQAYDYSGNFYSGYSYVFNDNEGSTNKSELYSQGGASRYFSYGDSPSGSHTFLQNDSGIEFVAKLRKVCNLSFSNPGRLITLNGTNFTSSASTSAVVQNTVSASAEPYFVVNYIEHMFLGGWRNSVGQLIPSTIITATQHDTYTPEYRIQPLTPNISFGTTIGLPIQINWTDNPNSAVTQYRIHRRVYSGTSWGPDQVIGTVGRGVLTFTDNDFILKTWRTGTWLEYGITAYYSVNNTWSSGGANTQVYGMQTLIQSNESALLTSESEVPTDYSISNYPNPFNPTTTISYQLPKDGMVTIKVYDILGKEVATLVNEPQQSGTYNSQFSIRNSQLSSGVYIATIQANNFVKSIKLVLAK
ncbi:MAG: hypothetical protein FD143_1027 [Ignavibacteria bacterium]|nr:MAG: hypothetical protein FD143_1027 [Ignavibacteria bacterium]KAF0160958.1 MAG: hypothetical protein FD188_1179 [Ignavibacteria bacterium]